MLTFSKSADGTPLIISRTSKHGTYKTTEDSFGIMWDRYKGTSLPELEEIIWGIQGTESVEDWRCVSRFEALMIMAELSGFGL